ncbi:MAG: dockerin type I domain-containing protein [Patescibacteria group bacterium]
MKIFFLKNQITRVFLKCCFFFFGFFYFFNVTYAIETYVPLEAIVIGEFIYNDDYTPTTDDCTISIYSPAGATLVNEATMLDDASGWHYYSYTTPAVEGKYPTVITCGTSLGGDLFKLDKSFILKSSNLTADDLSDITTVVTDSEGVITTAISTLNNITAAEVWSSPTRSLTTYGTLVADVWANGSRTLTSGGFDAASVWSYGTRNLTDATLTSGSLAKVSDLSGLATTTNVTDATSTLIAEIAKDWTVTLSDFGEATVNTAYKAKLQVLNYATIPTDADSLPTVVITDSAGTVQVGAGVMTEDSDGTYSYSYSIPGSSIGGVWETEVSVVVNGETVEVNDYWSLSSSPADVQIIEITDRIIPYITASVRIDNMGTQASDFYYVYCVVSSENNLCGGDDDIDSASDTAYINAGSSINLSLTLDEMSTAGTYWFKVKARALAETNWAASTEQFVAELGGTGVGGGGGGGGGSSSLPPATGVCRQRADSNCDDKINSIDFSILLYYWKSQPPFKNNYVDINKDGKVDSIDFSILLYEWEK